MLIMRPGNADVANKKECANGTKEFDMNKGFYIYTHIHFTVFLCS